MRSRIYYNVNPLRLLIFGRPVETEHYEHTRLRKAIALPVFSSDAISSSVYATQQILLALGAAGLWSMQYRTVYTGLTLGITAAIVLLLAVVVTSYWQTIFAYPNGGGSYIVSRANLGTNAGLISGGALLIDYVLTVSVSVAAGAQNLLATPFMARWQHDMVAVCVIIIAILTLANLRGLKESGTIFSVPTYTFISMAFLLIAMGVVGPYLGWRIFPDAVNQAMPISTPAPDFTRLALAFLVLKAFANGCAALTGVEAVSNGIPAFRKPESRNAALTLVMMAFILGSLFVGVSWLATSLHVVYWEHGGQTSDPVIDQLSAAIFGKPGSGHPVGTLRATLYYLMQFSTTAILVLAANTSFADFPRLSSIMAQDRFMPRPLSNVGDKLVFSNGIILLGLFAGLLIARFGGSVDRLIPLYAVGVFTAFTLSQCGMVRLWLARRTPGWWWRAAINGLGAFFTGVVLLDILMEKGPEGAYWIVVLIGLLFYLFHSINSHYRHLSSRLAVSEAPPTRAFTNTVLVLVPSLHQGILTALAYARSISRDCRAIHIIIDPKATPNLEKGWEKFVGEDIPLVMLESPYRSLNGPLLAYLDEVRQEQANHIVTVVLPEFVSSKWWHALLHNNSALAIKLALMGRPGVIVSNVRYFLDDHGGIVSGWSRRDEENPVDAESVTPTTAR